MSFQYHLATSEQLCPRTHEVTIDWTYETTMTRGGGRHDLAIWLNTACAGRGSNRPSGTDPFISITLQVLRMAMCQLPDSQYSSLMTGSCSVEKGGGTAKRRFAANSPGCRSSWSSIATSACAASWNLYFMCSTCTFECGLAARYLTVFSTERRRYVYWGTHPGIVEQPDGIPEIVAVVDPC